MWTVFLRFLVRTLPFEQIIAWLLNYGLDELVRQGGKDDVQKWQRTAERVMEAAAAFGKAVDDLNLSETEALELRNRIESIALDAWSRHEPTPAAFKDTYR